MSVKSVVTSEWRSWLIDQVTVYLLVGGTTPLLPECKHPIKDTDVVGLDNSMSNIQMMQATCESLDET